MTLRRGVQRLDPARWGVRDSEITNIPLED